MVESREELEKQIAEAAKDTEYDDMVEFRYMVLNKETNMMNPMTAIVKRYRLGFGTKCISERIFCDPFYWCWYQQYGKKRTTV